MQYYFSTQKKTMYEFTLPIYWNHPKKLLINTTRIKPYTHLYHLISCRFNIQIYKSNIRSHITTQPNGYQEGGVSSLGSGEGCVCEFKFKLAKKKKLSITISVRVYAIETEQIQHQ